jgi:hypothetical protein
MTCIAAIVDSGRVWIGGDSAVNDDTDDSVVLQADPKVFHIGQIIVGCCGDAQWESIWRRVKIGDVPDTDITEWVSTHLTDALRKALKELTKDGFIADCESIIGIRGNLYSVEGDGCPWRVRNKYYAIGSGAPPARGALYESSLQKKVDAPGKRLLRALKSAEHHTNVVRKPFHIIHT